MNLIELKKYISNKTVPSDFMIFVTKENPFLASQYIQAITELAPNGSRKVNSIYEPQQSSISLLAMPEGIINIINVETFDERAENYSQFENTIVICEQIDKSIASSVESYVIKFPKLEEWQILDYAKMLCPNIEEPELIWLIRMTDNSVERVINELNKVTLFPREEQKAVFASIRFDPQTDLYKTDLFAVVNALVEGDLTNLFNFVQRNGYEIFDPVMLANRTFTSLKNIIIVSQNPELTAEDCGVSSKQHYALKNKYRSLNIEAACRKLKFLTHFDLDLKTARLDMSKRDLLNYLISNLAYKIT